MGGGRPGCTGPTREGVGVCPLIRPSGPPSPRGEGFLGELPHSPLKGKVFGRLIAAPTERNPLGRAGEGTRPYGDCGRRTAGAQCAPLQEREREPGPSSAPFGGTCPYPLCPFGTTSLPLLAFGHFPLTGGIGPLTRGVGPQGEGLGKTKRDRSGTCPLKHRGETQFRRTFFCLLFFQEK